MSLKKLLGRKKADRMGVMRKFTIKIILLLFSFYILHFTFYISPVFASENDIGYSKLTPASPFYFLKGVREEIELRFALTPHVKNLRKIEFATRRLKEARALVTKNPYLIPASLERYIAQINDIPHTYLGADLAVHLEVLQKMYDDLSNTRAKMSIRSVVNKIVQRKDIPSLSKLSVCKFLQKEASSSALNQAEQTITLERAQKCLGE